MRRVLVLAAAALAVLLVVALASGGSGEDTGTGTSTQAGPPSKPKPPVPADWIRGANLTAYASEDLAASGTDSALAALQARGATEVTVVVTWYMQGKRSSEIRPEPGKSASDVSVLYAMRTAQAMGLKVSLKPHVDVLDGSFRGEIEPEDEQRWFDSYSDFVLQTAEVAERVSAERYVVGTELTSMADDEERFRAVIARARSAYTGTMTYAANWVQEAEKVPFWDALDAVGIDAYMPLTEKNQPTEDDLVEAWTPWTERMEKLHEKTGKPIYFTELGYPSRSGAAAEPSQEDDGDTPDPALQERLYVAAFRALSGLDFFEGVVWWDWPADGRTAPGSYSPRGKPAEQVLSRFWARPDLPPPPGASGASGAASGADGVAQQATITP